MAMTLEQLNAQVYGYTLPEDTRTQIGNTTIKDIAAKTYSTQLGIYVSSGIPLDRAKQMAEADRQQVAAQTTMAKAGSMMDSLGDQARATKAQSVDPGLAGAALLGDKQALQALQAQQQAVAATYAPAAGPTADAMKQPSTAPAAAATSEQADGTFTLSGQTFKIVGQNPDGSLKIMAPDGKTALSATADDLDKLGVPARTYGQFMMAKAQPAQSAAPIDVSNYLKANPDLVAAFASKNSTYVPPEYQNDISAFAQWHYQTYGQKEGRPTTPDPQVTDAQREAQFQSALKTISATAPQTQGTPDVGIKLGSWVAPSGLTSAQQAQLAEMRKNPLQRSAADELEFQWQMDLQKRAALPELGGTFGGGVAFSKLVPELAQKAMAYAQNHPNESNYQVLRAIGLSDNDISTLVAQAQTTKVADPKTPNTQAIDSLVAQLNPQAYANVAKLAGQTPEQLVHQVAGDLARYGVNSLDQVGVKSVGGQNVFYNKTTGAIIPTKFGSDMSGEGGKTFSLQVGQNGIVAPVPDWVNTSDKQDIATAVSVLATPFLAGAGQVMTAPVGTTAGVSGFAGMGMSNMAAGAILGGAAGAVPGAITDGLQGAIQGGLKGAAIGGAAGGIADYINGTGMFAPDGTPIPAGETTPAFSGYQAPNYSLGSGTGQGLQGDLAPTGYGFAGSGGETGLVAGTAPNLASMGGGTGLLATNPEGQLVNAGGVVQPNPGIRTNLVNDPANSKSLQDYLKGPQQGGSTTPPAAGSPGTGTPGTLTDWLSKISPTQALGGGLALAGAIGGAGVDQPDKPDISNLPALPGLGGVVGGSGGSVDAIGGMLEAANRDKAIREGTADQLAPYLADWLETGRNASRIEAETAQQQRDLATAQAKDSQERFVPVQNKMADEAMRYGLADDQEHRAAKAAQTANEETAAAVEAAHQSLIDMGINPNSGRFLGAELGARIKGAATAAGAANQARTEAGDKGIALRSNAANYGLNLSGQSQSGFGASADTLTKATAAQQPSVAGAISTGEFKAGNPASYMQPYQSAIDLNLGMNKIAADYYKTDSAAASAESQNYGNLLGTGLSLLLGKP